MTTIRTSVLYDYINIQDAKSPEERLWAAVLAQAYEDLLHKPTASCHRNKKHMKAWGCCSKCSGKVNALWWFKASKNGVGSFPFVCQILGLNANKMRKLLKKKGVL